MFGMFGKKERTSEQVNRELTRARNDRGKVQRDLDRLSSDMAKYGRATLLHTPDPEVMSQQKIRLDGLKQRLDSLNVNIERLEEELRGL